MINLSKFLFSIDPWITTSFPIIRMVIIIMMVLLAVGLVIVVLIQPSQSEGMGALTGQSADTYYAKNKSKSLEGAMKRLTVILGICMFILSIIFFVTLVIYPAF